MKALAVIPARSGSKGLKDKNIADICGKPLLNYTVKAALESGCFDCVMVSTDSEKYAQIAESCGAEVPFLRSESNSGDTAGTWDAVREVLCKYSEAGFTFDYVAVLQPTSPLRDADDIKQAFAMLNSKEVHNVVSVTETAHPVQWCFTLDDTLSMEHYANSPYNSVRRQDLETHYQENGAIYLVDATNILEKDYDLYKDNCFAYIMSKKHSVDIDEEIDLITVRAIIEQSKKESKNDRS